MLRYPADVRTLCYLACTAALTLVNWKLGFVHPVLYPITCFMFFTTAVISHNHNHLSIWKSRGANLVTSWVISLFYGHPAIGWVPTHKLLDWRRALLFFLVPQQVALFLIQCVNFLQHVETDPQSEWNHSRNFVSPTLNILLFNNGYHTVHHWKPGVHWSLTPKLHADVAAKIHPELLVQSWLKYVGYTYFVRPFTGAGAPPLTAA